MSPVAAEPAGAPGGAGVPQAADRSAGGVDGGAKPPQSHPAPVQPAVRDRTEHGAGGAGAGARAGDHTGKLLPKTLLCFSGHASKHLPVLFVLAASSAVGGLL